MTYLQNLYHIDILYTVKLTIFGFNKTQKRAAKMYNWSNTNDAITSYAS